jgi:phosphotransacetylase
MAKKFEHLLKTHVINEFKKPLTKQDYAKALLAKRKSKQETKENTEWQ